MYRDTVLAEAFLSYAGKIRKLFNKQCSGLMQEYDLTQSEVDILMFLANNLPHNVARDIAEEKSLSKSMVCKAVDSLTRRGYISSYHDPDDRRLIHLKIEDSAGDIVRRLKAERAEFFAVICRGLTDEEIQTQKRIMQKIMANIRKELEA